MRPHLALSEDLPALTETIASAFADDPVWTWAFPDTAAHRPLYEMFIRAPLRDGSVWATDGCDAAAVWILPGGEEMTPAVEAELETLVGRFAGPRAAEVSELIGSFDATHPHDREHYYLSLLGTHPRARGGGLGMDLLRHNLAQIDRQRMPAYLESTNPDNDRRYESVGFEKVGEFATPGGERTVATMWREPQPL